MILYKLYNYRKDNEINIFFDNQTFNLIGWQTKDIYQNLILLFFLQLRKIK